MNEITLKPIGMIHSPFKQLEGTPIQNTGSQNNKGFIELFPEFLDGLKDLKGFSHIYLIYYFHRAKQASLMVTPFLDSKPHGVFATRAPSRPNPIGISIVRLIEIEDTKIHVQGIDILDGTPLLDMKPYVPEFDVKKAEKIGWLENNIEKLPDTKDDGRFSK